MANKLLSSQLLATVLLSQTYFIPTVANATDLLGLIGGETTDKALDKLDGISRMRVDEFLKGIDGLSKDFMTKGAEQGRLLLVQSGNQLEILTASARAQFGAEMDHDIASTSAELKSVLVEMERWRDSKDQVLQAVLDLEDLTALDMENLPFATKYFVIRRVQGNAIIENDASVYKILVRGPQFGADPSGISTTFVAKFNGVTLGSPERRPPNDAVFAITRDQVRGLFKKNDVALYPLELKIVRTESGTIRDTSKSVEQTIQVALMPDLAGKLIVITTRPNYEWLPLRPPEVKEATVRNDYTFAYSVPYPVLTGEPKPDAMKIASRVEAICHTNMQPARKFGNGAIELETSPIFNDGWYTDKYIGEGSVENGDYIVADQEIKRKWDISLNVWALGRCGPKRHCFVTAKELIDNSSPTPFDVTGCKEMTAGQPHPENNAGTMTLTVRGRPQTDASWTVNFQPLTFSQKGLADDPPREFPIYASGLATIDVSNPEKTSSRVVFQTITGVRREGVLGKDVSFGPKIEDSAVLGEHERRYIYSFKYKLM